ncbi:MAG: acyl-CoA synthetase [Rubripirellula sp.]
MEQIELVRRAAQHGERIALCKEGSTWTFDDLLQRSSEVAASLLDGKSDLKQAHVGYLLPSGFDYVATQWGIWRAGGVTVPLSQSATESELEYAIKDSESRVIVTDREGRDKLSRLGERLDIRLTVMEEIEADAEVSLPSIGPERRAMILYTSGTTSKPKGVVTTHANLAAQIEALVNAWEWQPDDRIPLFLPLHHIHGIVNVLSCALWSGANVEMFPQFDVEQILRQVAAGRYTLFMAVPTIYVKLIQTLNELPAEQREATLRGFANMRLMVSGSAALPARVHDAWTALTGQALLERYGMTEIGMALSNPFHGQRRPGAVGQPLPGVTIRLKDEQGNVVEGEDTPGEIQVRGPGVFLEYWQRPQATTESFDEGWFQSGDIAVLEDGYYRIMGRQSVDIIKSGGYKLSALEIESVLLDHDSVAQCAVVGLPDETWGESVAAAVVLSPKTELSLSELKQWSRDRMSPYKIPKQLLVVESLPRNAMGKIQKPAVVGLFEGE